MKHITERHLKSLDSYLNKIKERLSRARNWRLMIGIVWFSLLVGAAAYPNGILTILAALVFPVVFFFFVKTTRKIQDAVVTAETLIEFYQRQNERVQGTHNFDWIEPGSPSDHPLAGDLRLFDKPGLLSQIDESFSDGGQLKLIEWMVSDPQNVTTILERQQLIKELNTRIGSLVRWRILGASTKTRLSSQQLLEFAKTEITGPGFKKAFILILISWIGVLASAVPLLSSGNNGIWVFLWIVYIGLGLGFADVIKSSFKRGEGLSFNFSFLEPLFKQMEEFAKTPMLASLCPTITKNKPSKLIGGFRRILNFLSIEANPILNIVVNAFVPWTYFFSYLLEQKRKRLAPHIPGFLEELHELEALASLCFLYRYQKVSFPEIKEGQNFKGKELRHPIIPANEVVANDFKFGDDDQLILLTGSNMAGKSTFLRTVGVNQILANMGAPVFAQELKTAPYRILSCIQVSDSLRDGFSYFYAEVSRLKEIIREVESGTNCMFLIDEIFRGTNNRERFIGSQGVIKSLVHHSSVGFVSTHDLELTKMETELKTLKNFHFREQIEDGVMSFSFKIHSGPCPTTNALKIMKDNGLRVEDI